VAIEVDTGATGGALQVLWDGGSLGCFPRRAGSATGVPLIVNVASDAGLHLLEVRLFGDGSVSPGAVRLLDAASR
jgi:hypothetical protein